MSDGIIIVIGGGPAGVSAAITCAEAGRKVLLVEQRDRLGGAIHRQPSDGSARDVLRHKSHRKQWSTLTKRLEAYAGLVTIAASTVFVGVDGDGLVLLENRRNEELLGLQPDGLVLALGALERVKPFPGWELPGVFTAGGMQVLLKETGTPIPGRTLLAGSGPLLLALAAQLCEAGTPPLAVLERAKPLRRSLAALRLLGDARCYEGLGYLARILRAKVPYRTGARILSAVEANASLDVEVQEGRTTRKYNVDNLVVHDGIRPSHEMLRLVSTSFPIVEAGDGREILGAACAAADGAHAASGLLKQLGITTPRDSRLERAIVSSQLFQRTLANVFAAPSVPLGTGTVMCRCEGRTGSSLEKGMTAREAKLVGRFGMGACQGRFCSETISYELGVSTLQNEFRPTLSRWPTRPISAKALARFRIVSTNVEKIWNV